MTMMYETDRLVYHLYSLNYDEVLIVDLKTPITREVYESEQNAYTAVNASMISTYWNIGRRIVEEEQHGKERAEYAFAPDDEPRNRWWLRVGCSFRQFLAEH